MLGLPGRTILFGGIALLPALMSVPATAAVITDVSVTNTYGYGFGSATPSTETIKKSDRRQIFVPDTQPNPTSETGVDYVGEAATGSFFFLHNDYCVGACRVVSSTTIAFTLQNIDGVAEAIRFDSLITPGHLARFGANAEYITSSFGFAVTRTLGGRTTELYSATGSADVDGLVIETSDNRPFSALTPGGNGIGGSTLDWSATNLNLELGSLAARDTMVVTYTATYSVFVDGICADLDACVGAQVVFGDPRNNGGGVNTLMARAARAMLSDDEPLRDVINRDYVAYEVPFAFVPSGSALPGQPAPEQTFRYGRNFTSITAGVPEPATWVSFLLGFGLVGAAIRRRRNGGRGWSCDGAYLRR